MENVKCDILPVSFLVNGFFYFILIYQNVFNHLVGMHKKTQHSDVRQ